MLKECRAHGYFPLLAEATYMNYKKLRYCMIPTTSAIKADCVKIFLTKSKSKRTIYLMLVFYRFLIKIKASVIQKLAWIFHITRSFENLKVCFPVKTA